MSDSQPGSNPIPFLHFMRGAIETADSVAEQYSKDLSPRFVPFECFNPHETDISRVFRMLLDPNASHGQGRAFLDLFTRTVFKWAFDPSLKPRDFAISTEHMIAGGRKLDLLVHTTNRGVERQAFAIENKPWAADQEGQIGDYANWLDAKYPQSPLIYLTKDGSEPPGHSLSRDHRDGLIESKRLFCVSYYSIVDWLKACRGTCRSERVRWFIETFADHLRHSVLGLPMVKPLDLLERILEAPENLRAALTIASVRDEILRTLIEKFSSQLEKLSIGGCFNGTLVADPMGGLMKRYFGWRVPLARFEGFRLAFQFEGACFTDLGWGIDVVDYGSMTNPKAVLKDKICQLMNSSLGQGEPSQSWAWWRRFGEVEMPYDWRLDGREWNRVDDGEMAEDFRKRAQQVSDALSRG